MFSYSVIAELLSNVKCAVEIVQEGDVGKTVTFAVRESQIRNGGSSQVRIAESLVLPAVLQAGGGAQHAEIVVVCGTFFLMADARQALGESLLLGFFSTVSAGVKVPRDPVDLNEQFPSQPNVPLSTSHPLHPDNQPKA